MSENLTPDEKAFVKFVSGEEETDLYPLLTGSKPYWEQIKDLKKANIELRRRLSEVEKELKDARTVVARCSLMD